MEGRGTEQTARDGGERDNPDLKVARVVVDHGGEVEVVEKSPTDSYRLLGNATGRLGWVRGEARFHLADDEEATKVDAEMDFSSGGLLSSVGARFMEAIAKGMLRDFFENFEREVAPLGADASTQSAPGG